MLWTIASSILFALMIGLGAVAALQFTITEGETACDCGGMRSLIERNRMPANECDCRPNCFCAECECGN